MFRETIAVTIPLVVMILVNITEPFMVMGDYEKAGATFGISLAIMIVAYPVAHVLGRL